MATQHEDTLIIGGGVIGVCAAYFLAGQGRPVTLLDRGEICGRDASSYGNAGLIVPSHAIPLAAPGVLGQGLKWLLDPVSPFYIKPRPELALMRWLWQFRAACREEAMRWGIPVLANLGQATARLFDELASSGDLNCGYERKGWLSISTTQHSLEEAAEDARLLEQYGVQSQVLDAAGVRALEPNVLPAIRGGVYFPGDAHLIPHRFVRELAGMAEQRGACLRPSTEVLGFELSGRRISAVVTTRGPYRPAQVVLAAGAWSPAVARDLGIRLPIQAAKGYSVTVRRPPTGPAVPLVLSERRVAVTPMGDMLRLGGTLELAGLDLSVSRRRVEAIQLAAREYLPGMTDLELIEIWRGLRPVTPDGLPIIGRSRAVENLIVAGGHAMLGMTYGPITGKLVSQIVTGEEPAIDLTPLRVERFS